MDMNKDEEEVRAAWDGGVVHDNSVCVWIATDEICSFGRMSHALGHEQCWSAAAAFTRERKEEVRIGRIAQNEVKALYDRWGDVPQLVWLKLVTQELARLTQGLKDGAA